MLQYYRPCVLNKVTVEILRSSLVTLCRKRYRIINLYGKSERFSTSAEFPSCALIEGVAHVLRPCLLNRFLIVEYNWYAVLAYVTVSTWNLQPSTGVLIVAVLTKLSTTN